MSESGGNMETLAEALERLEGEGYRRAFHATKRGDLAVRGGPARSPEDLVVDEVVRFEGQSDPDDQSLLFALATSDGSVRGTFVAGYGPSVDPDCAAAILRLDFER